jgi:hypothetical protein
MPTRVVLPTEIIPLASLDRGQRESSVSPGSRFKRWAVAKEIMGRADEFGTLQVGKLADLLVVDGDVVGNISLLEDRARFIAVMQGGEIKEGQLARPVPTRVKCEKKTLRDIAPGSSQDRG